MQSRDGLTDDIAAHFRDRAVLLNEPKPYPTRQRTLAVIAAWLVPGAGHLVLGRKGRALLFFVVISGAFALGLSLHGRLFWPSDTKVPKVLSSPKSEITSDRQIDAGTSSGFHFDPISALWFFAQIGAGLGYIFSFLFDLGKDPQPWAATYEYGNTFMFLAGLLNYLVIHDAFDIAAGRKR